MKIKTSELTGAALDWAVAKCEGFNVGVLTPAEQRARFLSGMLPKEMKHIDQLEAIAAEFKPVLCIVNDDGYKSTFCGQFPVALNSGPPRIEYSTSWLQGGPIIEREELYVQPTGDAAKWKAYRWLFEYAGGGFTKEYYGLTPLIAAMRCYVASKLGDEVEIPEELT